MSRLTNDEISIIKENMYQMQLTVSRSSREAREKAGRMYRYFDSLDEPTGPTHELRDFYEEFDQSAVQYTKSSSLFVQVLKDWEGY